MEIIRSITRSRFRGLVVLLFTLISNLVFSQDLPETGELYEPVHIDTVVTRDRAYIGQSFRVKLKTNIPYSKDINVDVEMPDGLEMLTRAVASSYAMSTPGSEIVEDFLDITITLRSSKPDIYFIPPITLSHESFIGVTDPVTVVVLGYDETSLEYPLLLEWRDFPSTLMVGQTQPLILEARYTENIIFTDRIRMDNPSSGMFEMISKIGEIESLTLGENILYKFPVESWSFTPTEPGSVTFPAASVSFENNIYRTTQPFTIEVIDPPSAIAETGAIGNFDLTVQLNDIDLRKGKVTNLVITISGEGNFSFLNFPEPSFDGFEVISSYEESNLVPDHSGQSGERTIVYRLQPYRAGRCSVTIPNWPYYDSRMQSVTRKQTRTFSVEVDDIEEEALEATTLYAVNAKWYSFLVRWLSRVRVRFLFFLIPISFLSLGRFYIKKRRDLFIIYAVLLLLSFLPSLSFLYDDRDILQDAVQMYELEQYQELYDKLIVTIEYENSSAEQYYNLALVCWKLSKPYESVYYIRQALTLQPGRPIFLKALNRIESDFGFESQETGGREVNIFIYQVLFILFAQLAVWFYIAYRDKPSTRRLIFQAIFILSLITLAGILTYSTIIIHKPHAVIGPDSARLKKVPGNLAESYVSLPPGTAIEIIEEIQGESYIRTGYDLEGWLGDESMFKLLDLKEK